MQRLACLVLLAGCSTGAGDDAYPVQPGGANLPPTVSDSGSLNGRACVVSDARDLTACDPTGAGDLMVSAGGQMVTTDANGSFSIPAGAFDGGVPGAVTISGPGVVPTNMALAAGQMVSVPVLRADLYAQMLAANGVTLSSGSGSIIGSVVRGGNPVTGASVASTPSPAFGPLFDGSTPTSWQLNGTGARGVVWIPGLAAGPTNVTFRDLASSGETTVNGVTVINGGITILDSAILP